MDCYSVLYIFISVLRLFMFAEGQGMPHACSIMVFTKTSAGTDEGLYASKDV
jgi:hypothetical protein